MSALRELQRGRATFVIAHRLSTIRAANRIVLLECGRVVGEGTHDDLLSTSPLYARLSNQLAETPASEPAGPSRIAAGQKR